MSKKRSLTVKRVFVLLLSYLTLCVSGGVVASAMLVPVVLGVRGAANAVLPSLEVEGIDFDVTSLPQKSRLYAADGTTQIASFYAQNRVVVPLKSISTRMQQAVVAREDRRFFEHSGVDVQGVLRAFVQTYIKRGDMQGGSSLTQQYVKNVLMVQARENDDPIAEYHASEDTIARKLREMLIAVQVERSYSKLEILQGYLNIAQFGTNNLYGVQTAAERYFGVSAADLSIVQAATIAAITKNPVSFDPSIEQNQEACQEQRNTVLDLMLQQGFITQREHDDAVGTALKDTLNIQAVSSAAGCQSAGDAAFFCDYVSKQILNSEEFGTSVEQRRKLLNEGGLDIYTTMDVAANASAMAAARDTIPVDDPSGFEVSIAAIRPGTGEVLGFGLNRVYDATDAAKSDPTHTSINYAVDERDGGGMGFQVGSTWKPINMVAWMQQGHSINESLRTAMRYNNTDFQCGKYSGVGVWSVQNSGGGTVSPETPLQGLIRSHNTTQAAMAQKIKLCAIADAAKAMGYNNAPLGQEDVYSANSLNPPMTIGSVQASPLAMANVYATLAANGTACTPIAIKRVVDKEGQELKVPSANCHQAIDPQIAQTTAYAMNQGVVQPGGEAAIAQLDNGRKTFAKTGTNEDKYMLTGGFTPNQVAAFVAVGNAEYQESFNGKTINGRYRSTWYGMDIAAPAWKEFMNGYLNAVAAPNDTDYGSPAPQYMGRTTTNADQDGQQEDQNQNQNQHAEAAQPDGGGAQRECTRVGEQFVGEDGNLYECVAG